MNHGRAADIGIYHGWRWICHDSDQCFELSSRLGSEISCIHHTRSCPYCYWCQDCKEILMDLILDFQVYMQKCSLSRDNSPLLTPVIQEQLNRDSIMLWSSRRYPVIAGQRFSGYSHMVIGEVMGYVLYLWLLKFYHWWTCLVQVPVHTVWPCLREHGKDIHLSHVQVPGCGRGVRRIRKAPWKKINNKNQQKT